MSVRPMELARPATPLHDRPVPRRWTEIDPILLIITLLLIAYGLVMTYSTTAETRTFTGDPMQFVIRGAIWAAVGLAVMTAVAMFDYAWLGTFAPVLYLVTLGLLAIVLQLGTASLGAQRSVNIAGLTFQFSEVAKILMIVVLAKYFADRRARIGSPLVMLFGLALLAPAVFLVYRQPDLGTSLVLIAIFFGILFALYIVLLFAALRVAFRARDPFGMLIGGGIATMLVFQILVNVGMAISLMPVTGIPLPFISHGGSSLVSICFALGVLQSVSMRREPEGP